MTLETLAAINSPSATRKRLRAMPFVVRYSVRKDGIIRVAGSALTWEDAEDALSGHDLKGTVQARWRVDVEQCESCGRKVV